MADGVAAQAGNPEVTLDASRPNTLVNDQIFTLRLITNKLENAYNGMDVEWDGNNKINNIDRVPSSTFFSSSRFLLQREWKWKWFG